MTTARIEELLSSTDWKSPFNQNHMLCSKSGPVVAVVQAGAYMEILVGSNEETDEVTICIQPRTYNGRGYQFVAEGDLITDALGMLTALADAIHLSSLGGIPADEEWLEKLVHLNASDDLLDFIAG